MANTTTGGAGAGATHDVENLSHQIHSMREEIASLASHVAGMARSGMRQGRAVLGHQADHYRSEARHLEEELEHRIGQHPMTSVLVALGLGFLIGLVSRH